MSTFWWLFLPIFLFIISMVGCAPGYYEKSAAGDVTPGYYETRQWYQNPETDEERAMRIWREEAGR